MNKIPIKDQFKDDYITRAAGERLRTMIVQAQQSQQQIEIDFSGIKIGSTSFFDEGIAKLKEAGWTIKQFEAAVRISGIAKSDRRILDEMCRMRGLI